MIDLDVTSLGLPVVSFDKGSRIIGEGKQSGALYLLKSGVVGIYRSGEFITDMSETGAVLGELSILLKRPSISDVRADSDDVSLYIIEKPDTYLASHPDIMFHIAKSLAKKLDFMACYLEDLKNQYAEESNHLGMVHEVMDTFFHGKR